MRDLFVSLLLTTMLAAGAAQRQGSPPAPQLSCAFAANPAAGAPPGPFRISNLKRIPIVATLTGSRETTENLRLGGGTATAPGTLEIIVVRRSASNARQRVEETLSTVGSSVEPDAQRLDLLLEVPIDRDTRRKNVERYLTRIEQDSAKAGRQAEFERLTQNRAVAIATFEQMYMESIPGDYEVTCRYSSRAPRFWNGTIEAPAPLKLVIVNDGSFFDQAKFR